MILKNSILTCILLVSLFIENLAQNRSIHFEQFKTWEQVVKKASRENKLIFIDCYTSWCAPCKMLVKNVFSKDSVADFYNSHFINVKCDVEKENIGIYVKKQYGVIVYPTLLFIDPENEELVHFFTGYRNPYRFLAGGEEAVDKENNLKGLSLRYQAGERNIQFISRYLNVLNSAFRIEEKESIAQQFLSAIPKKEWYTSSIWNFINEYIDDPLSVPLRYVMSHRRKFSKVINSVDVDKKLEQAFRNMTNELTGWNESWGEPFNDTLNTRLINYLQDLNYKPAAQFLIQLYTAQAVREKDYRGLLHTLQECYKFNIICDGGKMEFLFKHLEQLKKCDDKMTLTNTVLWLETRFHPQNTEGMYEQLNDVKQNLIQKRDE